MGEKIKLEIYIARPPTRKCRELLHVMQQVVERHPDEVRLVVFERGVPAQEEPSASLKALLTKEGGGVPLTFVGGKFVAGNQVPAVEEVEAKLAEVIREWKMFGLL